MTDIITQKYRDLAAFAHGIIPSRIVHEATRSDGIELINDLLLLASKVDLVIAAYGDYCEAHGIISARDNKDYFCNVLTGALEGNATFAIESGIENRLEALADELD